MKRSTALCFCFFLSSLVLNWQSEKKLNKRKQLKEMTFFHKPYFIGIYISSLNLSELNEQKEKEREKLLVK